MILIDPGPLTAYRMHTPKWASAATSGAGAATHGGRANRPGTQALYLALEAAASPAAAPMPPTAAAAAESSLSGCAGMGLWAP